MRLAESMEIWEEYCEGGLFETLEDAEDDMEARAMVAMSEGEQYAENAWMRHAERTTLDDDGFARWEAGRGII